MNGTATATESSPKPSSTSWANRGPTDGATIGMKRRMP